MVLKFFLPNPRSESGDRALAAAMLKAKVLIEAGVPGAPPTNKLPDKFSLSLAPASSGGPKAIRASGGAMPLPQFSAAAYDIGWVDMPAAMDRAP